MEKPVQVSGYSAQSGSLKALAREAYECARLRGTSLLEFRRDRKETLDKAVECVATVLCRKKCVGLAENLTVHIVVSV